MVRIALMVLVSAVAAGCSSVERAVARINSGEGIYVGTPYGGGPLGVEAQRDSAERNLYGWGGRPRVGIRPPP